MRRLISLLAFAGCFGTYDVEYDCLLVKSCADSVSSVRVTWTGTPVEVQETVDEWTHACHQLAAIDVETGRCADVVCAALCTP